MPLSKGQLTPDRCDFLGALTAPEVEALVADSELQVLQTSVPIDPGTCDLLNSQFFALRPDVELRLYGHYRTPCDLSILARMGNVRRFAANCLTEASGVENIGKLTGLRSLSIGIQSLESFEFLRAVEPDELTDLTLGPTSSNKPTPRVIEHFPNLQRLCVVGHQKDADVIGRAQHLKELKLCSITAPSLEFLQGLLTLWSLAIILGGAKHLAGLRGLSGIKQLELVRIKGLSDLSSLAEMTGLQCLSVDSLRNVTHLPDCSRLQGLRRVRLENMKGLTDVAAFESAPVLEEFIHVSAQGMDPIQYAGILQKASLKRMSVGFGSDKKNSALRDMMKAAGVEEYRFHEFQFL